MKFGGQLRVMTCNLRSLLNKFDEVTECCMTEDPDILAFTKTWLCGNIQDAEVSLPGYVVLRDDRIVMRLGGV